MLLVFQVVGFANYLYWADRCMPQEGAGYGGLIGPEEADRIFF